MAVVAGDWRVRMSLYTDLQFWPVGQLGFSLHMLSHHQECKLSLLHIIDGNTRGLIMEDSKPPEALLERHKTLLPLYSVRQTAQGQPHSKAGEIVSIS